MLWFFVVLAVVFALGGFRGAFKFVAFLSVAGLLGVAALVALLAL